MSEAPDMHDVLDGHQRKYELEEKIPLIGICPVCGDPVIPLQPAYQLSNGDVVHEEHFETYAKNELGAEPI